MKNLFIILVVFIFFSCGKKLQNKTLSSTLVTKDSTFVDSFEYQGSIEVTGIVTDELERRNLNTALIVLCVAAGMGTAMIIERV